MANKNIISNRCQGVKLVGDGLALGGIAKKHKKLTEFTQKSIVFVD